MVVEDLPGAGTVIGTEDVVRAAPDGNTLLFANNSSLLVPHLRHLDYDPLTSLVPICSIASTPTVIVVNSASPYRTLADLLDAARAKPGEFTFGAAAGAVSHVSFEMILSSGEPEDDIGSLFRHAAAGQCRPGWACRYGVRRLSRCGGATEVRQAAGARRRFAERGSNALPDVPTVSKSGFKDFEMELWYGFFVPAKTPPQTAISQLADWFIKFLQMPDTKARLATLGMKPTGACGADFAAYLHKQYEDYGRIIRDANIKAE